MIPRMLTRLLPYRRDQRGIVLLPLAVLLIAVVLALCVGHLDLRSQRAEQRGDVRLELTALSAQVQSQVRSAFTESEGLAQLIAVDGDISEARFAGMVGQMMDKLPYLSHIAIAPNDVVRDVYPREGNERLLGLDFRSVSGQFQQLEAARQARQSILVGPLRLYQGGLALVYRRPVFVTGPLGRPKYWGALSVVAKVDGLLVACGITAHPDLELALRGANGLGARGDFIWGDPSLFDKNNVLADVDIPGGRWQLAARPQGGWPRPGLLDSRLFLLCLGAGALLALLCAQLTRSHLLLSRRNHDLNREVAERQQAEAELAHIAHFDSVTNLPNRVLFRQQLDRCVADGLTSTGFAVLLLDIDGFKVINDTLGHALGDQLLQQATERLARQIRPGDTLARLGGDEFGFILEGAGDPGEAAPLIERLVQAMQQPFDLDGHTALVSASVGAALFPLDGQCAADLIRHADTAMYSAKEAGRNDYHFYQPAMTSVIHERVMLEHALRRALQFDEFELWYQPKVCLRTGAIAGAEALLRWRDPVQGLMLPDLFIPVAERSGLIVPMGQWVLEEVCRQQRVWREQGLFEGRIAINVAAPQIDRSNFVASVTAALERNGLPAAALEVEVTESLLMESQERARDVLAHLQSIGVRTAIDDFGTGQSSLAYLKWLPVDHLKIDRAFIRDLPDDRTYGAITEAIIALGAAVRFCVTAEGVETADQARFLRDAGCTYGQGYHFGRPMPGPAFEAWVLQRQAALALPG